MILVRLNLGDNAAIHTLYPRDNWRAPELLRALFQARLERDGIRVLEAHAAFDFNHSFYLLRVSCLAEALAIVKAVLSEQGLLPFAQVAWDDLREGICRSAHPEGVKFELPTGADYAASAARLQLLKTVAEKLHHIAEAFIALTKKS